MSDQPPRLSLIMPLYNGAKFLRQTLDTIVGQTFKDWELIIMDGASKDDGVAIAREYAAKHPNIHVYSEKDEGPFHAIWKAVQLARGEIMALICSSDGYWRNDWLAMSMQVFDEHPEVSLTWGIPMEITEEGEVMGPHFAYSHFVQDKVPGRRRAFLKKILSKIDLRHPSSFLEIAKKINRNNVTTVGKAMKQQPVPVKEDWFFYWLRTGQFFPDGSMCVYRHIFLECMPPYEMGSRSSGDYVRFFFNFNTRGYLSWCIPVIANFGRTHRGQVNETARKQNDAFTAAYHKRIAEYRDRLLAGGGEMVFVDHNGTPVSRRRAA